MHFALCTAVEMRAGTECGYGPRTSVARLSIARGCVTRPRGSIDPGRQLLYEVAHHSLRGFDPDVEIPFVGVATRVAHEG